MLATAAVPADRASAKARGLRPLLTQAVAFHSTPCTCRIPGRDDCIEDAEAFVARNIIRAIPELRPGSEEFDELKAEGLVILADLHRRYEPQRDGYARPGRFSGFAAFYLPKRLGDRWHKMHPEHRYVTDPETGKRNWVYLLPPASYDALTAPTSNQMSTGDGLLAGARAIAQMIPLPIPSRAVPA